MHCYCDTYLRGGEVRGRELTVGTGWLKAMYLSKCVGGLGCWLLWL